MKTLKVIQHSYKGVNFYQVGKDKFCFELLSKFYLGTKKEMKQFIRTHLKNYENTKNYQAHL